MPPSTPVPAAPKKKGSMIPVIAGVLIVLGLGYFGYSKIAGANTEPPTIQLGRNMQAFLQATSKGDINLDNMATILNNDWVKSLQDHTQTFTYSSRRGRLDPFLPYDSTRPIR